MKPQSFATYIFHTLAFRSRRRKEAGVCERPQSLGVCLLTSAAALCLTLSIAAPTRSHAATFTVTTTNDSGGGSLRQAILNVNAQPPGGTNKINFNISGTGPFRIQPTNALPTIVRPVIIDGYTQSGSSPNTLTNGDNAVLMIEISGANAGVPMA